MSYDAGFLIVVVSRLLYGTDSVSGVRIYRSVILIEHSSFVLTSLRPLLRHALLNRLDSWAWYHDPHQPCLNWLYNLSSFFLFNHIMWFYLTSLFFYTSVSSHHVLVVIFSCGAQKEYFHAVFSPYSSMVTMSINFQRHQISTKKKNRSNDYYCSEVQETWNIVYE